MNCMNNCELIAIQMTQIYTTADIAAVPNEQLFFPGDDKSQKALQASRNSFKSSLNRLAILAQIIQLENISVSKAAQLDELLVAEDIESVGADRRRFGNQHERVIRNVDVDEGGEGTAAGEKLINNATSVFKITFQDCYGELVYGIEQEKLGFLVKKNNNSGFPIQLGSKVIINPSVEVRNSVLLLKPNDVEFLGGLVPEWNKDLSKKHILHLRECIAAHE